MAAGAIPDVILLEDYNDLIDFLEYAGRAIPREAWAAEAIRAAELRRLEGLF